ncbi:MAG: T9SS type A sorting domain-containing protein [Bacteroidales bacterium]|nr:T9SS type A sorting domain-containing protein [Bacteroidales bacterium]
MKKNYNNYLSTRLYNGVMKLSLLIVMLLVVSSITFAQSNSIKVSTNAALKEAMYNPNVQSVSLDEGYYDLIKTTVLPGEEVNLFFAEGERGTDAECIYFINTRATCWIDGPGGVNDALLIEAGMITGDNCATPNDGTWTTTGVLPGTVTYSAALNIQVQNVDVSAPGVYGFKYTWANGRYVNGDYLWHDEPVIDLPTPADVCGLSSSINASFTVAVPSATQTQTWTYSGPGTATITAGTAPAWNIVVSVCGTYSLTYSVENGPCFASQNAQIKFFSTPVVSAGTDANVCGLTAPLTPSHTIACELGGAATETWTYTGPGTATVTGTYPTFTATVSVCGTYTFTYGVDNGPCDVVYDDVVVNFFDTPTLVNAGADFDVCGLNYTLLPSYFAACELAGAATETWTQTGGPGTSTFTGDNVVVSTCGIYTFTYTVDNGPCDPVSDVVVIRFFDTPVVSAGLDAEVCGLEYTLLPDYSASCMLGGTPTETWTLTSGPGTATFTGDLVNVSICGTYTFTYAVDNGPCDAVTDVVAITFFDTPVVSIAAVPDVCGFVATLTPTVTVGCDPGDMVTAWTQLAGTGTSTFTGNNVTVSACGSYTFTYSVTNAPCPTVSTTVNVDFYDTPVLVVDPLTPTEVCGYETDFVVAYDAVCELGGAATETVTQTAGPGTSTITFGVGTDHILVSQCGLYTYTYTVDNGPCTASVDFEIAFYEVPVFDIVGTVSPTLCAENTFAVDDLRTCEFGTVTYTWTITGGYIDDGGPVGSTTTVGTETITVVWNDDLGGSLSVTSATIVGCTATDTFTVYPVMPKIAGQVKYWNDQETYMPTPFPTIEGASYPHDYFYVTLYNGLVAIDTVIVEPRLDEDLVELMSYFEVDLGATYSGTMTIFDVYGCEGYYLKVWDGGLVYHPNTYDGVLGANYTYNNWGGVNATDALAIQLMATNININGAPYNFTWVGPNTDLPRFGYYSGSAANVNGSVQTNPITALDALTTNYRAVGLLDVFPFTGPGGGSGHFSPNFRVTGRMVPSLPYTTWTAPFDTDNENDVPFTHSAFNYLYYSLATDHKYTSNVLSLLNFHYINLYYLAAGDVNSSYIPTSAGFKNAEQTANLEYTEEMTVAKGDLITVPIRIDRNAQLGAITLNLTYNTGLIEVVDVNYEKDYYSVNAETGTLRIGWFNTVPANFGFGDAIALVKVRVLADIDADTRFFELQAGTDLADANAQSLKDIKLQTSAIVTSDEGLFVTNYPNPFNGQTMISYYLPSDSKVTLVVYNTMSQVVGTLVNANQNAGAHQVQFGSSDLKAGVYYYKLMVEGDGNTVVKTNSMIRVQ